MAKVWDGYFKAIPKQASGDDYGDQIYHTEAQQMLMTTMITPPWYNIVGQSAHWTPVRVLGFNYDPNYGRDIERDYAATTMRAGAESLRPRRKAHGTRYGRLPRRRKPHVPRGTAAFL